MKAALEVDLHKHFSLHIAALKFFHVWFYISHEITSYKFWLSVLIRCVLGLLVLFIPAATQLVYLLRLICSGTAGIQEIAGMVNLILTESLAGIKLLDLRLRRDSFTQLMNQLNDESFRCYHETHKRILEKGIKLSRLLFLVSMVACSLDVFFHVVVGPALRQFQSLPLKMDFFFFDINNPAYFTYACAYQILYKPMMVTTYVTAQTLSWACMCCANSQLDVLINKLENMKGLVKITKEERSCDESEAFGIIFKDCAVHHTAITRFEKCMQRTLEGQLTTTLFLSAAIIGTTAVQIFSIESPRKNITEVIWVLAYLSIFIGNLFAECYFGNAITNKGLQVSEAVFNIPWLQLSTKLKKNVIIFLAKSQQPMILTAAKLAPVSIETFTKIMNWTYKGFAVMNQMKK